MWLYATFFIVIFGGYLLFHRRTDSESRDLLAESVEAGLTEPASLHPLIDPARCLGCASCVHACPEKKVLGIIGNKAELVNPTSCIGHGACQVACPTDAITLVFGTERRGVDIPLVQETFETNVPGMFIAGELGGMGLIGNAIEQGRQAMQNIKRQRPRAKGDAYDVIIVGAGPSGISATLAAKQAGMKYLTLEQDSLGGTVAHFPRGKIVMTRPVDLPLIGKVQLTETTKEALLAFWQDVVQKTGIELNVQQRVDAIERDGDTFVVRTANDTYTCASVLLCIGRRGTPRKLGVPGEEMSKVVYRMIDPEQYVGQHVVVVGGGDSALEAAASIAEAPDTNVTLSYRGDAFGRAKAKNRQRVEEAAKARGLRIMLNSQVKLIEPDSIVLDDAGNIVQFRNDAVIVCAGGILPTPFLKQIGIEVETKYGTV